MARNPRSARPSPGEGSQEAQVSISDTDTQEAGPNPDYSNTGGLTVSQQIAAASAKTGASATGKPAGARTASSSGGADTRAVMVNDPDNNFQPIRRQDLIRRLWSEGKMSRSDITRVLNNPKVNQTPDKVVPYQIVFSATKGVPGGPPAAPAAPATVAAAPTSNVNTNTSANADTGDETVTGEETA